MKEMMAFWDGKFPRPLDYNENGMGQSRTLKNQSLTTNLQINHAD